jgi:sugar phosphate isomerase/epimerase
MKTANIENGLVRKQTRRAFAKTVSAAALSAGVFRSASAIEPVQRKGTHMKLSLAAYSFRQYLSGAKKSMTLEDFVDLCAQYDLDGTEPTSYYFPEPVTTEYLRRLRRRAFLQGLGISGTAVGNTFTQPPGPARDKEIAHVKKWVDYAVDLGAPVIRIFAGNLQKGTTEEQARQWAIEAINECCRYAGEHGIILALENHGGIVTTAEQLLLIVKAVQSDWFGVNLDTGNFRSSDPYHELEMAAPYAVTVQVKTEISPNGNRTEANLARVIAILKSAGYRGFVALEYEAREDPKTAVPRHLKKLRQLIES